MNFSFLRACGLFFLVFFSTLNLAHAGQMTKADLEQLLGEQFLVGDIQPGMPLWPLFAKNPPAPETTPGADPANADAATAVPVSGKPVLLAYAFETVDFEPVRGYGGKPINVLVVMDLKGQFLESKLLDHKEPLFRSEVRTAILAKFAAQYIGLTTRHNIQIYGFQATPFRDDKTANLHGVQAGTVTAKAIDKTILLSAASVALAHEEAAATGSIAGALTGAASATPRQIGLVAVGLARHGQRAKFHASRIGKTILGHQVRRRRQTR
jgi:hypothetical protein